MAEDRLKELDERFKSLTDSDQQNTSGEATIRDQFRRNSQRPAPSLDDLDARFQALTGESPENDRIQSKHENQETDDIENTLLEKGASILGSTARATGGAVLNTLEGWGNFAYDVANAVDNYVAKYGDNPEGIIPDLEEGENALNFSERILPSQGPVEKAVRTMGGYVLGSFGGAGLVKGARTGYKFLAGSIGGSAVADPNDERLANWVQENSSLPLITPLAEYLAYDEDDDRVTSRLKGSMEALLVDAVAVGAITGTLRMGKAAKNYKANKSKIEIEKANPPTEGVPAGERGIEVPSQAEQAKNLGQEPRRVFPEDDLIVAKIKKELSDIKIDRSILEDDPAIQYQHFKDLVNSAVRNNRISKETGKIFKEDAWKKVEGLTKQKREEFFSGVNNLGDFLGKIIPEEAITPDNVDILNKLRFVGKNKAVDDLAEQVVKGPDPQVIEKLTTYKAASSAEKVLDTPDSVLKAIKAGTVDDSVESVIKGSSRGVVSDKQLMKNAEGILKDRAKFEELITGRFDAELADQATAFRMLYERKALSVLNHIPDNPASMTDAQAASFVDALQEFLAVSSRVGAIGEEFGRGLRSLRLAVEAAPDDLTKVKMLENAVGLFGGLDEVKNIAGLLNAIKDANKRIDADVLEQVASVSKIKRLGDGLASIAMENMLQPASAVASLTGSAWKNLENVGVAALARGLTVMRRTLNIGDASGVEAGEVLSLLNGNYDGMIMSLPRIKKFIKYGEVLENTTKIPNQKGGIEQTMSVIKEAFGLDPANSLLTRAISEAHVAPGGRSIQITDIFNSSVAEMGRRSQLAHREAIGMGLSPNSEQYKTVYQNLMKSSSKERVGKAAARMAQETSFTVPTDEVLGGSFHKISEGLKEWPGGAIIAPFMRFSLNAADYALERTPGANWAFSSKFRKQLNAGGAVRDEAIAKTMIGSAYMGLGAYLSMQDRMTGSGPKDVRMKMQLESMGYQTDSILVGDDWYKIDRAFPVGFMLSIGADVAELARYVHPEDSDDLVELVAAGGALFANYLAPSSLVDLSDFFGGIEKRMRGEPMNDAESGAVARTLINFVPGAGISRSASRTLMPEDQSERKRTHADDPNAKILPKIWDRMKNEFLERSPIPGFRDELPPYRDLFGQPQMLAAGLSRSAVSFVYRHENILDDPVRNEIVNLSLTGPIFNITTDPENDYLRIPPLPTGMDKMFMGKSIPIRFTPEQYDRLSVLAAGFDLEGMDEALEQSMPEYRGSLINDREMGSLYGTLHSEITNDYPTLREAEGVSEVTDSLKVKFIRDMISVHRQAAMRQLVLEYPELQDSHLKGIVERLEGMGIDDNIIDEVYDQIEDRQGVQNPGGIGF